MQMSSWVKSCRAAGLIGMSAFHPKAAVHCFARKALSFPGGSHCGEVEQQQRSGLYRIFESHFPRNHLRNFARKGPVRSAAIARQGWMHLQVRCGFASAAH
jgi:hypothetical protein